MKLFATKISLAKISYYFPLGNIVHLLEYLILVKISSNTGQGVITQNKQLRSTLFFPNSCNIV